MFLAQELRQQVNGGCIRRRRKQADAFEADGFQQLELQLVFLMDNRYCRVLLVMTCFCLDCQCLWSRPLEKKKLLLQKL